MKGNEVVYENEPIPEMSKGDEAHTCSRLCDLDDKVKNDCNGSYDKGLEVKSETKIDPDDYVFHTHSGSIDVTVPSFSGFFSASLFYRICFVFSLESSIAGSLGARK